MPQDCKSHGNLDEHHVVGPQDWQLSLKMALDVAYSSCNGQKTNVQKQKPPTRTCCDNGWDQSRQKSRCITEWQTNCFRQLTAFPGKWKKWLPIQGHASLPCCGFNSGFITNKSSDITCTIAGGLMKILLATRVLSMLC